MILKNFRLSARFGKAHGLLLKRDFDGSYELLKNILKEGPTNHILPLVHEDLGIVEYHRGNYEESMNYMDYCIQHSVENPNLWSSHDDAERIESISWYYKASKDRLHESKT